MARTTGGPITEREPREETRGGKEGTGRAFSSSQDGKGQRGLLEEESGAQREGTGQGQGVPAAIQVAIQATGQRPFSPILIMKDGQVLRFP